MKRKLKRNPIKQDSYFKRMDAILSGSYPYKNKDREWKEQLLSEFLLRYLQAFPQRLMPNDSYLKRESFALTNYQNLFLPILDLMTISYLYYQIEMNESQYLHKGVSPLRDDHDIIKDNGNKHVKLCLKYFKQRFTSFENIPLYDNDSFHLEIQNKIIHYFQMAQDPRYDFLLHVNFKKGKWDKIIPNLDNQIEAIAKKESKIKRLKLKDQQTPSKLFLQVDNNWKWVLIDQPYNKKRDDVEADLMGHCATPEWENSNLISLRGPDGLPHITATVFALSQKGFKYYIVGQIKGPGNKKPNKKFEPQLFTLFSDKRFIQHIPQDRNDWQIQDFSENLKKALLKEKPYLLDFKKIKDFYDEKEIVQMIKNLMNKDVGYAKGYFFDREYLKTSGKRYHFTLDSIVNEKNDWILKYISDDYSLSDSHYFEISHDEVFSLIKDSLENDDDKIHPVLLHYKNKIEKELDTDDLDQIASEIHDNYSDVSSSAYRALLAGYESEMQKSALKRIKEFISDFQDFTIERGVLSKLRKHDYLQKATHIDFFFTPMGVLKYGLHDADPSVKIDLLHSYTAIVEEWLEEQYSINDLDWDIDHEVVSNTFSDELSEIEVDKND